MESDQPTTGKTRGPAPLTTAVRQRLQKLFEHSQRCTDKNDHDYANQLFSQCVSEDPANLIYLQSFLANLQKKYGDNKKGGKLAGLKIKSHRSALAKLGGKGDWPAAFQAGCAALTVNPWDIPTLLAMAKACDELGIDECQLYYLRWAIDIDAKDISVNRHAALTLQRMGQFDQAIACWHRVEQAKPHDEEALQAISRLSVEKTIHKGGYDPEMLRNDSSAEPKDRITVARFSKDADQQPDDDLTPEERLQAELAADPTEIKNYLLLADILTHSGRIDEAEKLLERGLSASGGGDLNIRERLEDIQLRRVHHQLAIAEKRRQQEPTEETQQQVLHFRKLANQRELEIYAVRADRDPGNTRLKFELGLRLKRAGKLNEAITVLQAARSDPKRKSQALVELGECFQKIEQYKLALANYEQAAETALESSEEADSEVRRLALYRAGVLATGLRELDRAERHLTELSGLDFGYRDVSDRLDKLAQLRNSE
jgi:tetratricopeptide (TPR) repeat protein